MDGEQARDDPALTASDHWKRETFYVAIDKVSNGIKDRFKKSQPLLEAFSLFAPSRFPHLLRQYKAPRDLQKALGGFCHMYKLDCYRCADELFSFYKNFSKFHRVCDDDHDTDNDSDDDAIGDDDSAQAVDEADAPDGAANADKEMKGTLADQTEDEQQRKTEVKSRIRSSMIRKKIRIAACNDG